MRRAIAISLMMLFSWTLIAPLLPANAEANLPACCRKNGNCHCGMCRRGHRSGTRKGLTSVTEKCPCRPASACAIQSPTYKPEAGEWFYAEVVRHPARAPRTEAFARISFLRGHPKRGPPSPFA
jgi:hypothetical protein